MKRLRVLISSHEFSPYQGSECAVGWNIATRMAGYHDVTVLCADGAPGYPNSYRNAINDYFARQGVIPGLQVVYVEHRPQTIWLARLNRQLMKLTRGVGWQVLHYVGLNVWHREVYKSAEVLGFKNFDSFHQLTPISFLRPGFLAANRRPFFWGPIGGMYRVPTAFACEGGYRSQVFEQVRSFNIKKEIQTLRFRSLVQAASRIWTITEDERRIIENIAPGKASPMIDTAPSPEIKGHVRSLDHKKRPLRLCWSGQHEPRKALPLLLKALAQIPGTEKVHLAVLGEGAETQRWQALAETLVLKNVSWLGRMPYTEAIKTMGQSDVLVHTSFREAASMVVLEALGWGMPVICHDACGMAVAVNDSCGIKIPFKDPAQSIEGFRAAILTLLHNPARVQQLSEGALRRAAELSWDAKVREMAEAYVQASV